MAVGSTVNDVFRFLQLRPQRAARQTGVVVLVRGTALVKNLIAEESMEGRIRLANEALSSSPIRSVDDVPLGTEITAAIADLRQSPESTLDDLRQRLPGLDGTRSGRDFKRQLENLSDLLLAAYFATTGIPAELDELQDVYRVYRLPDDEDGPMSRYLARALLAPPIPRTRPRQPVPGLERPPTDAGPNAASRGPSVDDGADEEAESLAAAVTELSALDRPGALIEPDGRGIAPKGSVAFTLTPASRRRLSDRTEAVLESRKIDAADVPLDLIVTRLAEEQLYLRPVRWPKKPIHTVPGVTLPPSPAHSLVRPAGVADLLVVKQQIKRYEAGEIAHVENVLIGEKKSRAHRRLERSEETFLTETESTRLTETELETADRFELNRETSRTIKADQKVGSSLSLSGKYGPAVEFTAKLETSNSSSQEETAKNSSRYARDVVSRSLERVTERIREVRSRTLIKETEETNLHELNNETADHVRGIYQFLDKVYETQVFNYGIRQMFDFMVPEPASFLWYVEANPALDVELPPAPPKLEVLAPDASYINEGNALELAAIYGATDVQPAPSIYKLLTTGVKHGEDNAGESGQPRSSHRLDLAVPAGYRPLRARIRGLAFTDEHPVISVAIGSRKVVWKPSSSGRVGLSDGHQLAHEPELGLSLNADPFELAEAKLGISVLAWETNTYSVEIVVVATRTAEELNRWRVETYKKIRGAHDDRVREHEQRVEELRAEAEARAEKENRLPFGSPPAINKKTVTTELKKHCLSIITQQRFDAFDATKNGAPPFFDFTEAAAEGAYIRFFEQAFEWDQLQYVFYPYFWGRKSMWVDRFVKQDVDPDFLEFLRAGAARVVVPVRPGFELAVTHFIETGKIWGGEGDPPVISSPLYVSIIDEIRERTGAPEGEKPVGEPWDARVPTALVLVRDSSDLPSWKRLADDKWEWEPEDD